MASKLATPVTRLDVDAEAHFVRARWRENAIFTAATNLCIAQGDYTIGPNDALDTR